MKIAIIAANNTRYSPYIYTYTKILEKMGVSYEIIVPDRQHGMDLSSDTIRVLPWQNNCNTGLNYIRYAACVKRLARKNRYAALVVLTGNNAVFLGCWLKRKYPGRYIVDIRDYTHENIRPYYWMERIAVRHSLMNVLSSDRFRRFLPEAEYHTIHNMSSVDVQDVQFERCTDRPINIAYVGAPAYLEQCKRLMRLIKADPRFCFSVYGYSKGEPELRAYAETLGCDRIRFFGGYVHTEKEGIIRKADVLFNAYGNDSPLLDYALSNKLYDSIQFRKPIITSPYTYMDEIAGPLSFAIDLKTAESLDEMYRWYSTLSAEQVEAYAEAMHKKFKEENEQTQSIIEARIWSVIDQ